MRIGGLEAGGTKMVCALGDETGKILDKKVFLTEEPQKTMPLMIAYFKEQKIDSLGVGCFGPIDLNRESETYGYITKTPKLPWRDYDIVGAFRQALKIPIGFDTDVNGAILGEVAYGAARGCDTAIYITIGTGVGVGVYANGKLLHGLIHPEAGHIMLSKHPKDTYAGKCPYHKNCLEGLAAGPAIEERWGMKAEKLSEDNRVWELEAYYLAQAISNYILTYSPQKIILWGGVMHQEKLFSMVREKTLDFLNGYLVHEQLLEHIDNYIVSPQLGDEAGIKGALRLGITGSVRNAIAGTALESCYA